MATEVRTTNTNNTVWIVLGVIAALALLVIVWMAVAGGDRADTVAETGPREVATTVVDTSRAATDAASDSAAAAAQSAREAADRAAETARNVGDSAQDATGRVTANIPAGDANIRVDAPVR